jgi:hypothetical protein
MKHHREIRPVNLLIINQSIIKYSTALSWALTDFSVSKSYSRSVELHGLGISPSQGHDLHTGQHRINAHTDRYHSSGIRPRYPSFGAHERSSCLRPSGQPCLSQAQVMWDLWLTNGIGRFSPSTSVSPANLHSTDCSTFIIYHPGLVQ